eukprot:maker-scaffold_1-snap-gene-3.2-mRNA-1 protein AED:0.06 eAED:0.06 QI:267/1/1/1/0.5/0.33/3/231/214
MLTRFLSSSKSLTASKSKAFFSTAAPVELPIQLFGVNANYANALFKIAVRQNTLDTVEKDLTSFSSMIKTNEKLKSYLDNPIISTEHKVQDITKVADQVGLSKTTSSFLAILAENDRLGEFGDVVSKFSELMKAKNGIVEATVKTASELSKADLKRVKKAISDRYLESGKTLRLKTEVEPALLGGLQLQLGETFLDLSTQTQINKVHKMLMDSK